MRKYVESEMYVRYGLKQWSKIRYSDYATTRTFFFSVT